MRRRKLGTAAVEVVLSIAVIALTVVLFLHPQEYVILYPVIFGLAAFLSLFYAFDGVLYNKDQVTDKGHAVIYCVLAVVLSAIAFISAGAVL